MLKLYMILLGFKPKGFITEQHDIVFVVAKSIDDAIVAATILKRLPVPRGTQVHMDAYVEVNYVQGYQVVVGKGPRPGTVSSLDLYFANLGGYKLGDFQEYHKKLLLVLGDATELKAVAQKDVFFAQMHKIPGANPHLDDKHRLNAEVEDELRIADILDGYHLVLQKKRRKDSLKTPVITGFRVLGKKKGSFRRKLAA